MTSNAAKKAQTIKAGRITRSFEGAVESGETIADPEEAPLTSFCGPSSGCRSPMSETNPPSVEISSKGIVVGVVSDVVGELDVRTGDCGPWVSDPGVLFADQFRVEKCAQA